jgi:phage-related protein
MRARMASALFGDEGQRMINFLGAGRESLEAMTAEARKYGVITTEQARAAEAFGDAQSRLQKVIAGLGNTNAGDLLPVLQPLIDRMTEWIAANRQLIATEVVETVKRLAASLAAIDWAGVIDGARGVGQGIAAVVDFMGGWGTAIAALVALVNAPLIGAIAAVASAMGKLALVFVANPVLAGVAAIAAATLLIYNNWDAVSGYFSRLWAGVRELFSTTAGWIDGKLHEILPAPLYAAWTGLTGWYGDLFGALMQVFTGLADFVVGVFTGDVAGAVDGIKQAWEGIGDYFDTILAPVAAAFDSVWGTISPIIDNIRGGMSAIADSWVGRQLGFGSEGGEATEPEEPEVPAVPGPVRRGGSRGTHPSLVKAAKAAGATGQAPVARVDGEVLARVEFANAPPGTRVVTESRGDVTSTAAVGYSTSSGRAK